MRLERGRSEPCTFFGARQFARMIGDDLVDRGHRDQQVERDREEPDPPRMAAEAQAESTRQTPAGPGRGRRRDRVGDRHCRHRPTWRRIRSRAGVSGIGGLTVLANSVTGCKKRRGCTGIYDLGGRTTLSSGSPRARWSRFAAIWPARRRRIPVVHPEECGVRITFGSLWNGCLDGGASGLAALG